MKLCFADTETYSECNLKVHGSARYAEDPSTEIIIVQWAIGDEEPTVWDCTEHGKPQAFIDLLLDPDVMFVWQNGRFDVQVIEKCWGISLPLERCYDTMAQAQEHGLPGSLEKIGQVLGHDEDEAKDKRGRDLIQLFSKPRPANMTLRRATRLTHPTEWLEFLGYSRQDVISMRAVHRDLPNWNYRPGHFEMELFHLDAKINARGVAVDTDLARAAIDAVAVETKRLKQETVDATDGLVSAPSKRDALLTFILAEYGVTLPDMKADTLRRRLEDPDLPDGVKLLLSIRLEATKTSTAKYKALLNAVSADGRLRNMLQFCGAQRTGRWAGRTFQPQNMPRPDMKQAEIDLGIEALKAGTADLVFGNDTMRLTANAVRGCIVAPPGRKLCIADLSNIEGRGLAYLAGEKWKLKAFADFDRGIGADLYKVAYARAFNLSPDAVTKDQRQQGKVMELGCLAGDTPVVTNNGVKAIMAVSQDDLLWDGESWVKHEGVVAKGVKPVVNVDGIELTSDHRVLCGPSWKEASELASNVSTLSQALVTGSESLLYCVASASGAGRAKPTWQKFSALAALRRTPSTPTTSGRGAAHVAIHVQRNNPLTGENTSTGTRTSFLIQTTARGCSIAFPPASTGATTPTTRGTSTTVVVASMCTNPGAMTDGRFWPTSSPLTDGISRLSNWTGETSTKGTNPATCVLSPSGRTTRIDAPCESYNLASPNLRPTFDILNAGPKNRFTVLTDSGALIVHNCGYEGGVAAFLTFAAVYNMDLDELADAVHSTASKESLAAAYGMWDWTVKKGRSTLGLPKNVWVACEVLKASWRTAHAATKQLWADAKDAVASAIQNPGVTFDIGQHLKARRDGAWLRIRLPSGRYLCYLQPKVENDQITYMGVNQYTRQWSRIKTYGGKIIENCTQAFARDVMAYAMPKIEEAGYEIVLSVHDELLTETPDTDEYSHETLASMMATAPPWAQGIPLAAAGFETTRYRKE